MNSKIRYQVVPHEACDHTLIEDTPKATQEFKYKPVWQRVRLKLKVRLFLISLLKGAIMPETEVEELEKFPQSHYFSSTRPFKTLTLKQIPFLVFLPDNFFLEYWNAFISLTMLYVAFIMPFSLAFLDTETSSSSTITDYCFSGVYFLDFLFNCTTAYIDNNGNVVLKRMKILLKYAKTWMLIDILAFFPFGAFDSFSEVRLNPLFKLIRVTRLYRLFKLIKAFKCLKFANRLGTMFRIEEFLGVRHTTMRFIAMLCTIITAFHIISCMWYLSAKLVDFSPDTWPVRFNLVDSDTATLYLTGLYWAVTTFSTTGYGDVSAYTIAEMVISMVWMVYSMIFLGFTIGTLSGYVNSIDTVDKELIKKLAVIDEFSSNAGLSNQLRRKLRYALRQSSSISGFSFIEKYSIFAELPKSLRKDVSLAMHHGAAKFLNFFSDKDDVIVSAIVPYLTPLFINSGKHVYKYLDFPDQIYFIVSGKVCYLHNNGKLLIFTIKKKDYFGDIELMLKIPRKYHALTKKDCEFLTLPRQMVHSLYNDYKAIWYEMKGVAIEKERVLQRSIKELEKMNKSTNLMVNEIERNQTHMMIDKEMTEIKYSDKLNKEVLAMDITEKFSELSSHMSALKNNFKRIGRRKSASGYNSS